MDQSTDMEMLVTGIKVRPARTPEPAATDRRTRREPRSIGENARREREIFFRSFARALFRATRVARDGPSLRLSRRPSLVENSFPRHAPF